MGDLGRDSRNLRQDGTRDTALVERIERARAPSEQEQVEVRRCELFARMLRGDLSMVAVGVWKLERSTGMSSSWAKKGMDW